MCVPGRSTRNLDLHVTHYYNYIYRTLDQVNSTYENVTMQLENAGCVDDIVTMFHGEVDKASESRIPSEFRATNSPVRCIISTIAFGMGINIPDIRYIIHWGSPRSVLDYWQEVGRGARDGGQGYAILYKSRMGNRYISEQMKAIVSNSVTCIRKKVLEGLKLPNMNGVLVKGTKCCSVCDNVPDKTVI